MRGRTRVLQRHRGGERSIKRGKVIRSSPTHGVGEGQDKLERTIIDSGEGPQRQLDWG